MRLIIVGTGYVGLVSGACFAEMGNNVVCVDVDEAKVTSLRNGVIPIYEPGLEELVIRNHAEGRLTFEMDLRQVLDGEATVFIAVGTPPDEDGSADLKHVVAVAKLLGQHIEHPTVVINKSTVPVGTAEIVRNAIQVELDARHRDVKFEVVSNPEFLKEGSAVEDFMKPDRIIIGSDSPWAIQVMSDLYASFNRNHHRTIVMGVRDAEMTKYAANAMLATKISFINEIANLCDKMGVDIENVRQGIGSDARIGFSFIYPGCGYGGSCFPKDVKALIHTARQNAFEPELLVAVEERNRMQKSVLAEKIFEKYGRDLTGRTFAMWGLAFKPGTDDMREAPSLSVIEALVGAGARIRAHDPAASMTARRAMPPEWFDSGKVTMCETPLGTLEGCLALVITTEWKPYRHPDFEQMKALLSDRAIFDGRNLYDPVKLAADGFYYRGIGRRS